MMSLNEFSAELMLHDVACFKQAIKQNMAQQGTKNIHRGPRGGEEHVPTAPDVLALLAIDGAFRLPEPHAEASNLGGGCLQKTLPQKRVKHGKSVPKKTKIEFLVYTTFLGKFR